MPETYFDIRWPNGKEQSCYSPSSVVSEFFQAESDYPLAEFMSLSESALSQASERVKLKFGYYCSSAADQLKQLQQTATQYNATDTVTVLRIRH
jgi:uncharacterized repeat protein (TIGR04042 family)